MLSATFDEGEVEVLIRALRYWRAQRNDGLVRRTDSNSSPATVDLLLAKLEGRSMKPLPSERWPADFFRR